MKFGKVTDISTIDFSLPPANYQLPLYENYTPLKLYIGATAWVQKLWKGEVYPEKVKAAQYLRYYSTYFGTVELNSTFYTIPKKEQIIKWKDQSDDEFRFCPKVYRGISHSKDFGIEKGHFDRFIDSIIFFEEKLGACFLQLPDYFGTERKTLLLDFLSYWPAEIKLNIEIRNKDLLESWCKKDQAEHDFLQLLHLDVSGRRDLLHGYVWNDTQVIRWVGNGMHHTDYSRAKEWATLIKEWQRNGVKNVYLLLHQPDNILTPKISSYFSDLLKECDTIDIIQSHISLPSQAKLF